MKNKKPETVNGDAGNAAITSESAFAFLSALRIFSAIFAVKSFCFAKEEERRITNRPRIVRKMAAC